MTRTEKHPCFDKNASKNYMRVHLPIAPLCNIQCRYCDRNYDCLNESRPGVTSALLSPYQALYYFKELKKDNPGLTVAGIAGPGDALADPEKTLLTLSLIKSEDPSINLCISTNGLNLPDYVDPLKETGLDHITVTVNAVDPAIGSKIYKWIRYKNKRYMNKEAAEVLLEQQLGGIKKAVDAGMKVKINTLILPGINTEHIPGVAKVMAELGVFIQNTLPVIPVKGTELADIKVPDHTLIAELRKKASVYLHQMTHCGRCRSDAFGYVAKDSIGQFPLIKSIASMPLNPYENRTYCAVSSREGILINKHLGQTEEFYIYEYVDNQWTFKERRKAPPAGGGDDRWEKVIFLLADCHTLLVNGVGPKPFELLSKSGIKIYSLEGMIDEALMCLASGEPLDYLNTRVSGVCSGCNNEKAGCL
ncbi:MAG: radical SAM protein [Spirochaetales bacterium]|nr:radical SAM protein [Spirochaetales bacterium]